MEKRVFYHDTDAGGIVYYARYLDYLEEARTEFLERKGLCVDEFRRRGLFYAVRRCSILYRSPARYGDILVCGARLKDVTAAQLIFAQTVRRKDDDRTVVEAEVVLVSLDVSFKPVVLPDDLRVRLTDGN